MIKINALYLLLLIELLVIFAGLVVFLVFREKKRIIVYQENKRELDAAQAAHLELQKQVTALTTGASRSAATAEAAAAAKAPSKADTKDYDACKMEVTLLEEKLKEKNKLLVELQAKYDSVEKEYLLLYQQQQQAQELNKS
jgi:hypothetical protein